MSAGDEAIAGDGYQPLELDDAGKDAVDDESPFRIGRRVAGLQKLISVDSRPQRDRDVCVGDGAVGPEHLPTNGSPAA